MKRAAGIFGFLAVFLFLAAWPVLAQENETPVAETGTGYLFRWLNFAIVFGGIAYPPRPYRLLQGVELQPKRLGNLGFTGASRQKLLALRHHALGQHRRTARHPRCIKSLRSVLPIPLHRPLDADRCHAESPDDVALLGIAADAELTGDHAKGRDIFLSMGKHRHVAVEIRYLEPLAKLSGLAAARQIGDVVGGRMDSACLKLRAAATFWRVWTRASVLPAVAI